MPQQDLPRTLPTAPHLEHVERGQGQKPRAQMPLPALQYRLLPLPEPLVEAVPDMATRHVSGQS